MFGRIESAMICNCRVDSRKASKVFSKEDFSSQVGLGTEYMKLFVGKIVDNKTRGSVSPLTQ